MPTNLPSSSWWNNLALLVSPLNRKERRARRARNNRSSSFQAEALKSRRLFTVDLPKVFLAMGEVSFVEGSFAGIDFFRTSENMDQSLSINFSISGDAERGTDYFVTEDLEWDPLTSTYTWTEKSDSSFTLDPYQSNKTLWFFAVDDAFVEDTEPFTITIESGDGYDPWPNDPSSISHTKDIIDNDVPEIRIDNIDPVAVEAGGIDATFKVSKNTLDEAYVELTFTGQATPGTDYLVYVNNETTPRTLTSGGVLGVTFSGPSFDLRLVAIGDNDPEIVEDVNVAITYVSPAHTIIKSNDDAAIIDSSLSTSFESILGIGCTCFACSCASANAKQDQATGQPLANVKTIAGQEFVYAGSAVALRNLAFQFIVPPELGAITKFVVGGQVGGSFGRTLDATHFGGSDDPRGKTHYVNYQIPADEFAIGLHDAEIEVTYYFENGQTATHKQTIEYFNLDATNSEFGAGWRPRGYSRLYVESSGLFFDFGDGNTAFFRETTSGVFKADPSPFINFSAKIVENLDGTYTYDDGHRNLQNFRADGYLLERVDRDGNVTEYVHSDLDSDSVAESLTSIVDPAGRAMTFEYASGKISKAIGIDGSETLFAHDSSGRLISVTEADPDGAGSLTAPVTTFTYSGTSYRLASITDAEGHTVSYAYDANGYLSSISESGPSSETITTEYESYFSELIPGSGQGTSTSPLDYAIASATSSKKIDHDGKVTEYFFNRFGQANKIVHYDGTVTVSTFSADGLLLESIDLDPDGAGPLTDRVTTYAYDTNGNVTSITYSDASTVTFTYDLDFNEVTSYTDQLGRITLYTLDATYGRLTSVTRVMGEIDDAINLETDDAVVAFTYMVSSGGVKGLVETATDAEGNVTKFVYDAYGRVTETIRAFGTVEGG